MPLFSRLKSKGGQTTKGRSPGNGDGALATPAKPRWLSQWNSNVVDPDEIAELVHFCTAEMKSRAEALDAPFLLLPFRPETDASASRTFIRNFFKANAEGSPNFRGQELQQELRLARPVALCSIMKWCWSRMPDGVVSWPVYEGFRLGEKESRMARNAFDTFIPISTTSEARKNIIFDFFDLLTAVAAHGKMNGFGGRKLSRLAGWWAFSHSDDGKGFEGGYKSWTSAADATSHLFFAYLRSLSPDTDPSMNLIERIPRSLQALLVSTEYPPEAPTLLQRTTPRVVMLVDAVSPTPFALLRRAKNFEYRDKDQVLRELAEFEDPVDALTDECKRVLYAVASTNQSTTSRSRHGNLANQEQSWSTFQNLGFSDIDERALSPTSSINSPSGAGSQSINPQPNSRHADGDRPTTPSWAEFLNSGFVDDDTNSSPALKYPPAQVLPPFQSRVPNASPQIAVDENLAPGELAAVTSVELDDAFWWVWMTSLAGEEPSGRKAVFGRCALVETNILNGRWLIMEEQMKGASPDPSEGVYVAPKKGLLSTLTKRGRLSRKRSIGRQSTAEEQPRLLSATPSRTSIAPSQTAKIKAAAAALTRKPESINSESQQRRARTEDPQASKTNSMHNVGLQSEAGPAMKWTSAYDKSAIRAQYLGDSLAGKGISREDLVRKDSSQSVNAEENLSKVPTTASVQEPVVTKVPTGATSTVIAPEPVEPAKVAEPAESSALATVPSEPISGKRERFSSVSSYSAVNESIPSAFDKEIGVGSSAAAAVHRKPLPRVDNHPAFRQSRVEESKPVQPSPAAAAAAAAAQKAMLSNGAPTVESQQAKYKKQPPSGGLKKFFVKKGEETSNGTLAAPAESGVARRLSLMRKKPAPAKETAAPTEFPQAAEPVVSEPTLVAHPSQFEAPSAEISQTQPQVHEEPKDQGGVFSRFDQGPIADMPSATPEDTESEASPTPNQHKFESFAPQPPTSHPVEVAQPAYVRGDAESEMSMDDTRNVSSTNDRWATRQSEEQSVQSRMSHSARTDDGETSGEETIESRVARIKARVAQLTGNMDNAIATPR